MSDRPLRRASRGAGSQNSGGFLKLPNVVIDEAPRLLKPNQFLIMVQLMREANWYRNREGVYCAGVEVVLDKGEVLFSSRSFAQRYGWTREEVRRTVARLARVGWIERFSVRDPFIASRALSRHRREDYGDPAETGRLLAEYAYDSETIEGPEADPEVRPTLRGAPTVIRFVRFREVIWPQDPTDAYASD